MRMRRWSVSSQLWSNDESPDWGRGFTPQLPAGHCHLSNIVLMKAVTPSSNPGIIQSSGSMMIVTSYNQHHHIPAIYWTFLTRYIMPSLSVSQHKLCGHARLVSCEKFQPFWDCFNDLFIKPITKPEEWQTCPHQPHSPPQSRFASPISPTNQ